MIDCHRGDRTITIPKVIVGAIGLNQRHHVVAYNYIIAVKWP